MTNPSTGKKHALNTPNGVFSPSDLMAALESVGSGRDPKAVINLVQPYKDRPEVLTSIFKAMELVEAKAVAGLLKDQ